MPIAPRLPLNRDFVYGYGMNDTIKDTVRQNLTNLLLTIPGERVMDPEFGVGLKKYLFEPISSMVSSHIEGRIRQQVSKYMGFLSINEIFITDSREIANLIHLSIDYTIVPLNLEDQISVETTI
jgi:phage baseplate assembly protein W